MTSNVLKGLALIWVCLAPFALFAQSNFIHREYKWDYQGKSYSMKQTFDRSDYVHYRSINRHWRYKDYVKESPYHQVIKPIVQELSKFCQGQGFSQWETVEFLVVFVQSLEYQKETSSPEYPKYPIETLVERGGDCEDTAILLAAIFREMGISTILISPPGHMATAIAIDGKQGTHIKWKGKNYHYIETTGNSWEIGTVPKVYLGQMTVHEIPGKSWAAPLAFGQSKKSTEMALYRQLVMRQANQSAPK